MKSTSARFELQIERTALNSNAECGRVKKVMRLTSDFILIHHNSEFERTEIGVKFDNFFYIEIKRVQYLYLDALTIGYKIPKRSVTT